MRSRLAVTLLAVAGFAWSAPQAVKPEVKPVAKTAEPPKQDSTCISCHKQLSEAALEPTKHLDDIHFQKGLSCHDCHGGDPTKGGDDDPAAARARREPGSIGWRCAR